MERRLLYHKLPISIIEKFQSSNDGVFSMPGKPIDQITAKIERYRKGFDIIWADDHSAAMKLDLGYYLKNIKFKIDDLTIQLDRLFIHNRSGRFYSASVASFKTVGFTPAKKYYFRLLIPLKKKFDIHLFIEHSKFNTDLGYTSIEGVIAEINGDKLQVCVLNGKDGDNHYLAIESTVKQDYETFSEKTHAIKNGLGYITGHLPSDAGYYFAYNVKTMESPIHFCFTEWRNTIMSMYQPIYANPFGYIKNYSIADKWYKKNLLRPMVLTEFSALCNKLHESKEFTGVIILILEASITSLILMPAGYAIALETMADLIIGNIKVERSLIPDKATRKKILKGFRAVVDAESANLDDANRDVLIFRINQLPQGTNKSRLRAPFDILGINLSEADLKVIESRNAFLHGRLPQITQAEDRPTGFHEEMDLFYAALRLYTLLSRMILKWIGYDNFTLNQVKIKEEALGLKIKEDYYYKD